MKDKHHVRKCSVRDMELAFVPSRDTGQAFVKSVAEASSKSSGCCIIFLFIKTLNTHKCCLTTTTLRIQSTSCVWTPFMLSSQLLHQRISNGNVVRGSNMHRFVVHIQILHCQFLFLSTSYEISYWAGSKISWTALIVLIFGSGWKPNVSVTTHEGQSLIFVGRRVMCTLHDNNTMSARTRIGYGMYQRCVWRAITLDWYLGSQ